MSVMSSLSIYSRWISLCRDGKCDTLSVLEIRELKAMFESDLSLKMERTQCAHIFAESTNADIELGSVCPYFSLHLISF